MTKPDNWQDALAMVIGAQKCSPVERKRAFNLLHTTGIGYKLPGHISETLTAMVASGEVGDDRRA